MPIQLRDYQYNVVDRGRTLVAAARRKIIFQMSTGAGKTAVGAHILERATSKGAHAHFWVHRRELIKQSVLAMDKAGVECGIISAGFPQRPQAPVQICSIPSLPRRIANIKKPNIIIVDECFVAGSMVHGVPIENIRVGSVVNSWNEKTGEFENRRVVRTFVNPAPPVLFRVSFRNTSFVCTGNHPVLTNQGWVNASDLREGDKLHGVHNLRWTYLPPRKKMPKLLQDCSDGSKEQGGSARENANTKSNGGSVYSSQSQRHAHSDRTQTDGSRRERTSANAARTNADGINSRTERTASHSYWNRAWKWLSNLLQVRSWDCQYTTWDRGRWRIPLSYSAPGGGSKESTTPEFQRVDRIEILKQGGTGEFERVCPDGLVYNFEVEGTNTYTVNGIVVHNCHHAASATWSKLIEYYSDAVVIGLTATPYRLDGSGLGKWFQDMVLGPTTQELIEAGWLSKYRLFCPTQINTEALHTIGGEYNPKEVSELMKASPVVGDAIHHYQKYVMGKRAIMFLWSIESSMEMAAKCNALGIPAVHIDGSTPEAVRDQIFKDFAAGKIWVLCNVDIVAEGLDVPSVSAIFMLRPTKSLSRYLQMVGRAMRPSEGKTHAYIFDHSNSVRNRDGSRNHGLPDDDQAWSLEGKKKKKKKDEERVTFRMCPACKEVSALYVRICPCGYKLVMEREIDVDAGSELEELDPALMRKQLRMEQGREDSIEKLIEFGRRKGYKNPDIWARIVFKAREEKKAAKDRWGHQLDTHLETVLPGFNVVLPEVSKISSPDPWDF